jgi:hypothetical protein
MMRGKLTAASRSWVKRYPYPLGPDGEGEVEIREVFEASDFGR